MPESRARWPQGSDVRARWWGDPPARPRLCVARAAARAAEAGFAPEVIVSGVDEDDVIGPTAEVAAVLAERKARAVAGELAGEPAIVLGCDTVLDVDGETRGQGRRRSRRPGRGGRRSRPVGHPALRPVRDRHRDGATRQRGGVDGGPLRHARPSARWTPTSRPVSRCAWPAASPSTATRRRSSTASTATTAPCSACRSRCCGGSSPRSTSRSPTCGRAPMTPRASARSRSTRRWCWRRWRASPTRRSAACARASAPGLYVSRDDHGPGARRAQRPHPRDAPVRRLRGHAVGAALRHRPAHARRGGAVPGRRARRRPRRHELRLPGPQGHPQGRRLGAAGAPRAAPRHRPVRRRGRRAPCRSPSSSAWAWTTRSSPTSRPVASPRTRASPPSRSTPAPPSSSTAARPAGTPSPRSRPHVTTIPVLGNGDIWEAHDALAMMAETGLRRRGRRPRLPRPPLAVPRPGRRLRRPGGAAARPASGGSPRSCATTPPRLVDWSGEAAA